MKDRSEINEVGAVLTLEPNGFHDSQGRFMYFRGVNVAANSKYPPFIPFEEVSWWDRLVSWGFNLVRLTLFWEAIEPQPGIYDSSYLDKVGQMVDQASSRGMYILLDMHQDLYSRWLHGDGAPDWSFPESVNPKNNDGFGGRFWGCAYTLSRDVRACFTNFFESAQLREHYRNAWAEVAKRVKDNRYILGYDIMNEPSCGNIANHDGHFENNFLKPFYEETIACIRQVNPGAVGFVEPHILDLYTSKLKPFNMDRLVYAPHFYNPVSNTLWFDPLPEDVSFSILLSIHEEKAKYLGMPLFIGEFGSPWKMQPFYARDMAVNDAMEVLEKNFVNSAYWDYSVKDVDAWNEEDYSLIDKIGSPRGLGVNVRPYVRNLRGIPLYQSFDRVTGIYSLKFKSEPGAPPTVIYVPETIQYPDGFRVCVSDGFEEYRKDSGVLLYYPSYDCRHSITIEPKVSW